MTKLVLAAAAACLCAPAVNAAAMLTSAEVTGPSGTVWNTALDTYYTLFLMRPVGNVLNPTDNFTGSATTLGENDFVILGDGWPVGNNANSDPVYTLTLKFADGAVISGDYLGSTFVNGTSATVGGTTYTLNGFGWDRSRANNVSPFEAVKGGDVSDYTGQFSYSAVAAAVPEPATWALFVIGFGSLGASLRRRAKSSGTARRALQFA